MYVFVLTVASGDQISILAIPDALPLPANDSEVNQTGNLLQGSDETVEASSLGLNLSVKCPNCKILY